MAKTEDYIIRITNASALELVLVSHDIMLDDLNEAVRNCGTSPEMFISGVNTARDALAELVAALDFDYPIAGQLLPIYEYLNTLFLSALVYEKKEPLEEAVKIITILREGWEAANESVPSAPPLFAGAPKVYTGLTYGKKGPSEFVDEDPNRGIKA